MCQMAGLFSKMKKIAETKSLPALDSEISALLVARDTLNKVIQQKKLERDAEAWKQDAINELRNTVAKLSSIKWPAVTRKRPY